METETVNNSSVTTAVVYAVSDVIGRDPTAMPPLADAIDADALESLFRPRNGGESSRVHVSFRYADCRVTVDDRGQVTVDSLNAADAGEPRTQ